MKIKMLYKCIFELNGECAGDQPIGHLFNRDGLDVIGMIFQS
jgi:hypothetical protein